jgi:formylglycine-generating enzyme required for sulfatase activity
MRLALIPAGTFIVGSPDEDNHAESDEKPQLSVRISKPFYLGIHEVTQRQYCAVMGVNPSHFKGSDDLPAEQVSWLAAVRFCIKLSQLENLTPFYRVDGTAVTIVGGEGYRLPTDAE